MRSLHLSRTASIPRRERLGNTAGPLFGRIVELYRRRYRLHVAEDGSDSNLTREDALFQMWLDENLLDR